MDNEKIKQLVLEMKCLGEVAEVNGMTVEGNPLHPLINDAWQTIAALSQPAAEGWKPSDEEVQAWNIRHDEPFQGRLDAARCAIDDARSMHMLAASTTPPQEQPEAVEPVAWMWRRHYSGGGFITGLKPTQEQARALCELFKDGGTYDEVKPLFDLSPTASQALRMAAEICRQQFKTHPSQIALMEVRREILALIPPTEIEFTDEQLAMFQDNAERYGLTVKSDQRKPSFELPDSDRFLAGDYLRENPMYSRREVIGFIAQARKLGFAEGVKAAAEIVEMQSPENQCQIAAGKIRKLTPPTDTVTMTRDTGEEIAVAAWQVGRNISEPFSISKLRAIVAQHMPEESK